MESKDIIGKLKGNKGQLQALKEEQRQLIIELAKQLGEHLWENYKLVYGYHSFSQVEVNRDAAQQQVIPLGYRLPTLEEYQLLIDSTIYSFDETTKEGVFTWHSGYELRFPALGCCRADDTPIAAYQNSGMFWSSTPKDTLNAYFLSFDNGRTGPYCLNDDRSLKCQAICIKQFF